MSVCSCDSVSFEGLLYEDGSLEQARLTEETAPKLQQIVPGLTDETLLLMQRCPMRSFNEDILQEPNVYRTYEVRRSW